jgi:hypothetical protein
MSKKKIEEGSSAGGMGGTDGAFAPENLQKDPIMAQNTNAWGKTSKDGKNPKMVPGVEPNEWIQGNPCFNVDTQAEYNSFCKGVKRFHLWRQHTKSEDIRQWANANPGRDFYISHAGSYTKINRSKK